MRVLVAGLAFVALVWSGFWGISAQMLRADINGWLEDRRAEGWQAEARDIAVTGFPLQFNTTMTAPALADPDTGFAWTAPEFTVTQGALTPGTMSVRWPSVQTVGAPGWRGDLQSDALATHLETEAAASFALVRAGLNAATLTLEDSTGNVTSLANLTAEAVRRGASAYDITFLAEGVVLSAPLLQELGPDLPQSLERVELSMQAAFDRPWDLRAIDTARPQPTALIVDEFHARWGPMALRLSTELTIDAQGIPDGDVALRAENWRDMLGVIERAGVLPPHLVAGLSDGLRFLSGMSGNRDHLDVTLRMAGGRIFVGPLPIGPAPRLHLR